MSAKRDELEKLMWELAVANILRDVRKRQRRFEDGTDDVNWYEREIARIARRVREIAPEIVLPEALIH
jgi:hypothetical protein